MKNKLFFLLLSIGAYSLVASNLSAATPNVSVTFNPTTSPLTAPNLEDEEEAQSPASAPAPTVPASAPAGPGAPTSNSKPTNPSSTNTSSANAATETADVYLNFENVSLNSVVNYLAERKKINLIPHKDLEAQRVSLSTRKPLTLERAWKILLTLLEVNGFSIVQVDNLHRIVSNKDNGVEPLPYYSSQETSPENLPDSDLVIRYLYFFKNIKPEVAQDILKSMLEGDKSVQPLKDLQAVLIKDKCYNIKAAMKIIQELDTGGLRQAIRIVPLKEADADTVQKLFSQDIIGGDGGGEDRMRFIAADGQGESTYFSSATKIIADSSKNALIILGTPANIDKICNFIYKYIDVPIGSADSRIHIRELRYAKADTLKPILDNIIKPPSGQGSDKSSVVGQFKFFEDVIIKEDVGGGDDNRGAGNRLIVSANQEDWARLDKFIDMLDKPTPQIAFEVMIVDINLSQDKELGAQLQSNGALGMGLNRALFSNLTGDKASTETVPDTAKTLPAYKFTDIIANLNTNKAGNGTFATLGTPGVGENNHIWAILRATFETQNSHIVSQPFLITNNFQECSIKIGETRRVPGPLVSEGKGDLRQQKIEKPADTEIKLTPQINYDGIVNLKMEMTVNEFGASDSEAGPPIVKRAISTRISMAAGEVLVLGGMTKSKQELADYHTPLLSKIPILGNLFRSSTKNKTETNLYVFIRPSVIKPNFEGAPDEYTQLKLDYAKYQMMKNDTYAQENDPIQRWYFKPTNHSIQQKLADARNGVFRPIDDFTYGKRQPKTVDIKNDPYFSSSETISRNKKMKALKSRKKA